MKMHRRDALIALGGAAVAATSSLDAITAGSRAKPVNAFPELLAAGRLLKEKRRISQLSGSETDEKSNAVLLKEKQGILRQNRTSLRHIEVALTLPYREPLLKSSDQVSPHMIDFLYLVRLLVLDGQVKEGQGDRSRAMGRYLDAIRFGELIQQNGPIFNALVGVGLGTVGRRRAWALSRRLSVAEAKSAIKRMQSIVKLHMPHAQTLRAEKHVIMLMVEEQLKRRNDPHLKPLKSTGDEELDSLLKEQEQQTQRIIGLYGEDEYRIRASEYMDRLIRDRDAERPYPQRNGTRSPRIFTESLSIGSDPIASILQLNPEAISLRQALTDASDKLLLVALALRVYRLERGHYPRSLDDLVPAYLNEVPNDPFQVNGPLRYRKIGPKYRLYSVGPDGADDGGVPIFDSETETGSINPANRKRVNRHSKGDIVAGFNFP